MKNVREEVQCLQDNGQPNFLRRTGTEGGSVRPLEGAPAHPRLLCTQSTVYLPFLTSSDKARVDRQAGLGAILVAESILLPPNLRDNLTASVGGLCGTPHYPHEYRSPELNPMQKGEKRTRLLSPNPGSYSRTPILLSVQLQAQPVSPLPAHPDLMAAVFKRRPLLLPSTGLVLVSLNSWGIT